MKDFYLDNLMKEYKTSLKYDKYKEYYRPPKPLKKGQFGWSDKQQWIFKFENNYGASVVKHWGSFGWDDDLFELAVIKYIDKDKWHLCYDTQITHDVIGYLTNDEILELLEKIKGLD